MLVNLLKYELAYFCKHIMTSSILIKCLINFAPYPLGLMIALAMCLTLQT